MMQVWRTLTKISFFFPNSIFTCSWVSEKQMNSKWTQSNILCDFQKHLRAHHFKLYTWKRNHGDAHMFESDMHGRTSKGLVGHAWKGPNGFSLTRKPHEKQNRAFTYFIDGKSDIVGYRQLDIICQFRLIYCRYVFHSYNVGTLVGPIFVQSIGRTMFVQCSYNGQTSSYNVRTIHH